jgi:hypothetical protein
MGILDDAIREHLELKRNHGATDSELQRMEDEAFGPPSRPGEPDFPEGDTDAEHAGNGAGHEELSGEAAEAQAEPAEHEGDDEAHPPVNEGHPGDEGGLETEAGEGARVEGEEQTALDDETAESSRAPIESLDTVEHPMPGEEVEEEQAEGRSGHQGAEEDEEAEDDDAGEDEDVLADTPEFLKDAPEDDELWFEQGKPKDIDF